MYGVLSHGITAEAMVTDFSDYLKDFWWPCEMCIRDRRQYVDYNPYQGMVVSHKVRHVFLRGQKIIEDGAFKTDIPAGNYLLRNTLVR